MIHFFRCGNGHEWEAPADETATCPVCGQPAGSVTDAEEMTDIKDELPPLPCSLPPRPTGAAKSVMATASAFGLRFRIIREHAEGGLGKVYVAEDEELHREVALKEIKDRHADNPQSRLRFLVEAEITGGLEHPGIVPVYGLGQYADGRPFYAMRFIRGESLNDALERFHQGDGPAADPSERTLEMRKLLGRFIDVCDAVEYAHARGVLHRDLKPSNIMLGKYGETLVVDWGLAKLARREASAAEPSAAEPALRPASAGGSAETVQGSAVGTPSFMSPEQAAGQLDQLGPASDVYSLGATLYCLLTGRPPLHGSDLAGVLKKIGAGDFPAPRLVKPTVEPALEAICLKAMSLKPADRYRSPRALADDLEHWLADKPVSAWPDPWNVKTRRWVGAHRTLVTGVAAALCVGLVGLLVVTFILTSANERLGIESDKVQKANDKLASANDKLADERNQVQIQSDEAKKQARRAEKNFGQARQAVARLTQVAKKKLGDLPRMEQEQRAILQEAHKFFQELPAEDLRDPLIQSDLGKLYGLLGNVELRFGNLDRAEGFFEKQLGIQQRLAAEKPAPEHKDEWARSLIDLADLYNQMNLHKKAEETHRRALALREKLAKEHVGHAGFQTTLAEEHYNLALTLADMGRTQDAEASYRQAIALLEKLEHAAGAGAEVQDDLSGAHLSLGAIYKQVGRYAEAEKSYLKALAATDKLAGLDADRAARYYVRQETRRTYYELGNVRRTLGNLTGAEEAYRKALAAAKKLAEDFPSVPDFHLELGYSYAALTGLLAETGQPTAELNKEALEHWRRFPELLQAKTAHRAEQARLLESWADRLVAAGNYVDAEKTFRQALAFSQKLHEEFPAIPRYRRDLAFAWENVGVALDNQGKIEEAGAACRKAVARHEKLVEDFASWPVARVGLADARARLSVLLNRRRQSAEAEDLIRRNLALREKLVQDFPDIPAYRAALGHEMDNLRNILTPMGRVQEAEKLQRRQMAVFESLAADFPAVPDYRRFVAIALSNLAIELHDQGRDDEAEKIQRQALTLRQKLVQELPDMPLLRQHLGHNYINLGIVYQETNRASKAEAEYLKARQLFEELHSRFSENAEYASDLAATCNSLGNTWRTLKQPLNAKAAWEHALQLQKKLVADQPDRPDFQYELASSHGNLGLLFQHDLKQLRDAEQSYRAGLKTLAVLVEQQPKTVMYQALLGEQHGRLGGLLQLEKDFPQARAHLEKSVRHLRQALQVNPTQPRSATLLRENSQAWIAVMIQANDDPAAAKTAGEMAAWFPAKNEGAFLAAKTLSWGMSVVDSDASLAEKERRRRVSFLGEQAVAVLRKSPPRDAKQVQEMKESRTFQLLRRRDDFTAFLEKLER